MEFGNKTETALELLEMEPSNDDTETDTNDTILKKGKFVAFRGTDDLPLNILQLTKDYQQDSTTPKTRINGNFLDHKHQEIVLPMSDPQ